MTRDDALRLLRGGTDGVAEWNGRRQEWWQTALDLRACGLSCVNLAGVNLESLYIVGGDFRGANLERARMSRARLQNSHFAGASLRGASFEGCDLSDANFDGAQLDGAQLEGANLTQASFVGASLAKADLAFADLLRTDLHLADLTSATLAYAKLIGTNLSATTLIDTALLETVFAGSDLTQVDSKSMSTLRHLGPSMLATDTLALSKGRLPPEFLRGVGFLDWEIEAAKLYDPSLSPGERSDLIYRIFALQSGRPFRFYSVFISHGHHDKAFAKALFEVLQARGIRCWLDEHQILPGDKIVDRIDHGIRHWDKVILCCSETALERSWWVEDEVDRALAKERAIRSSEGRTVRALIPLDLDGHVFSWTNALSGVIKERKIANFRNWREGDPLPAAALDHLVRALQLDGEGRAPVPPARL
jgi:uncharacterized protein YjbI with pentapeptide repeats